MLHVAYLRSPHPHARIRTVDVSRAQAISGVYATLTGAEVASQTRPSGARPPVRAPLPHYCLAHEKTRYVGQPVAAVAAIDRATAEDAAEQIVVDYEPLEASASLDRAMEPDAPLVFEEAGTNIVWHEVFPYGDVDGAFAAADEIVRERFRIQRYASTPLETFGSIAVFDRGTQRLTIWGHSHLPGTTVFALAHQMDLPQSRIRFIQPHVGGGFGNKTYVFHHLVTALLSRKTGRPVKYVEDRRENLVGSTHAASGIMDVEAAVKRDGTILGLRLRNAEDEGVAIEFATRHSTLMMSNLVNCYRIPAVSFEVLSVLTNRCHVGANRGVGKPFMCFAVERTVDRIAQRLGLDRAEVRFRNFIPSDAFPYTTPSGNVYDPSDFAELLRLALERVGYAALLEEQQAARQQGRYIGIGICTAVEPAGTNHNNLVHPQTAVTGMGEAARVKIEADGRVLVWLGGTDTGQGHETAISQIIADELGVAPEDVDVLPFDSATSPWTIHSGSYANKFSGTDVGAIIGAARKVRQQLVDLAARQLEIAPEDVRVEGGRIFAHGIPGRWLTHRQVAMPAYSTFAGYPDGAEPGLEAVHYYANPMADVPDGERRVRTQLNFSSSAHLVVVEVDPGTYQVKILRYVIVHDCGKVINPMIVEGQVAGATAHGIGAALLEEFVYDDDGQLLSTSFMDYLKPTTTDVPDFEIVHLETPSPFTPLGTKSVGEGGAVPAPAAIASAVEDALRPFGVEVTTLPLSPSRIRDLVFEAKSRMGGR
jgi:2-furoyl-CoA dehydrogenase large subunit